MATQILHGQNEFPVLKGPYFGQKAPIEKAEVFLDGIITTLKNPEICAAFTKSGKEFYYNACHENSWAIFSTKEVNGNWSKPKPLPFTSDYTDRDFIISPGEVIFMWRGSKMVVTSHLKILAVRLTVTKMIGMLIRVLCRFV